MLMNTHEARLDALRKELKTRGLDGFVIPISDEHMSEYVGAYAQRLAWLTGFGGSAGTAAVLGDKAAIFVDGRYTLQVREQVDGRLFEYQSSLETTVAAWLADNAASGMKIGFDPWLHGKPWAEATARALQAKGATLEPVDGNPIDAIWADQPAPSPAPALVHGNEYAGQSSEAKRSQVAEWLSAKGLDAAVVSALDGVAWLLNLRGTDVDRTPVALSFVLAHADGTAELFIAEEKVTPELRAHLGNAVTIRPREAFVPQLQALAGKKVAVDPERSVQAVFGVLSGAGAQVVEITDPTVLPKAQKNPVEQAGQRAAQSRDGAAIAKFLHWLSVEAPKGGETELSAAAKLRAFRDESDLLRDLSFDTISAAGPHAASPHYRVDEESNLTIAPNSIYLVDSGGQYLDGTTDITRTVWVGPGEPTAEHKDRFTRVLKGHIMLALAVFPKGTVGAQLDTCARYALWQAGVDYAHGTGHGVGSFLSVHEGPQRIAKASGGQAGTGTELLPGMILSNEPGYYKAGDFGIRIENLVLVERREIAGAEGEYFGFENLTWAPIDKTLVETALLTREELKWWDDYHAQVETILAPQLEGAALAWLKEACAPLSRG
ncbi:MULTISPECIES: aminopeptidase P family protein [unclassified Novosphingobium]|uniref:aminopeptidase P family protein n=1 Tax=unclassified Novosphingobium TaxID=2644732 RepID=UPI000EE40E0D|nr:MULTISPECIES: aminopeptidase P family protein [unclassified Novosphingobium]HCF24201.1 X-Pro aminopeptidase [Novosphingobium sp.]HQV04344.1 aminopeptidase P family protein [Novosphingobium sp.]